MSENNFTMTIISNILKYEVYLHDYKEFIKQYGTYILLLFRKIHDKKLI